MKHPDQLCLDMLCGYSVGLRNFQEMGLGNIVFDQILYHEYESSIERNGN